MYLNGFNINSYSLLIIKLCLIANLFINLFDLRNFPKFNIIKQSHYISIFVIHFVTKILIFIFQVFPRIFILILISIPNIPIINYLFINPIN